MANCMGGPGVNQNVRRDTIRGRRPGGFYHAAMPDRTFTLKTPIDTPPPDLFAWHERDGALPRLTPPWEYAKVVEFGGIRDGQKVVMEVKAPWKRKWVAVHKDFIDGLQFRDEQVEGPFAMWEHTHRIEPDPQTGGRTSVMHDHVRYRMPFWLLGEIAHAVFGRDKIEQMFAYRHGVLKADIEDHNRVNNQRRTIAVTGSSGAVGSALVPYLTTGGHAVRRVHRPDNGIGWQANALSGADVVVHLAGEPIAQKWTKDAKQRIRDSRVEGTRVLSEALARLDRKPKVLVAASAIGFYGSRGDELLSEHDPAGDDFLADIARDWEAATRPAAAAGIRVVNLRLGVVLDPRGGALREMLPIFRKGLGGKLAGGKHWWSWIGIDDVLGVVHRAIFDDNLIGPVNTVAPDPVTNAQFTKTLARVLRRPAVFPVPRFAVSLRFGEMGRELLLSSHRVDNTVLRQVGFQYRHPDLEGCLRALLGKRRDL